MRLSVRTSAIVGWSSSCATAFTEFEAFAGEQRDLALPEQLLRPAHRGTRQSGWRADETEAWLGHGAKATWLPT